MCYGVMPARCCLSQAHGLKPPSVYTLSMYFGEGGGRHFLDVDPPCQCQLTIYKEKPSTDQLTNNSASHRFAKASVVKLTRSSLPCRQRFGRMLQSSHQQMLLMVNGHLGQLHVYLLWFCRLAYSECHQLQSEIPYLPMFWGVTVLQSQAEYEKPKPHWETCHPHIFMWKLEQPQSYQPSQKGSGFTQSSWGSS